jgi:hypothetical protein
MSDPYANHADASTGQQSPGKSPFAPGSPFAEYYRPPHLGIIHLLAWTAATAVLLKFSMAMEMIQDTGGSSMPPSMRVFQQIFGFIYSTAFAAGIVGTCIVLRAKMSRLPGRLQPGHWLLLIATVSSLLSLARWAFYVLAETTGLVGSFSPSWILVLFGLEEIICSGMYFGATLACRAAKRWKVCFAVLAAVNFMRGVLSVGSVLLDSPSWAISFSSLPLGSMIVGLVLLLAVLVDLRRGPRRDWLHWLGVAIIATGVLVYAAWWAWSMFAMPLMESALAA